MGGSIVNKIVCGSGFSSHIYVKLLFAAVFVAMVALIGVASAGSSLYSGGDGTSDDPYLISNSNDIGYLSTDSGNWTQYFIVTNDIDLAGCSPTATIGNSNTHFTGSFDGKGYTISNLELNITGDNIGLFGYVSMGGEIRNLNVETDANGVYGANNVGVIVGYNEGALTNCSATGNVTATGICIGGLVGRNEDGGSLTNCYATGDVDADDFAGGLVGKNEDGGSLTNCYATGDVDADYNAGGLVGQNEDGGSLTNCSATGDANAIYDTGGLVGFNDGFLTNCYATGNATASISFAGGLVGDNNGALTNCYATGNATGISSHAGGLVGRNKDGSSLTNCYATGTATVGSSNSSVGGLVGSNTIGPLTNCYRYTGRDSDLGTLITDITKFKDYDFLTKTTPENGLNWSTGIISTDADSSKIWRTFTYNVQYPIFQWQSFGNGTLQVHSSPENATISFNGISTGLSTNHTFNQPIGVYNVTVQKDGYDSASETVTLTKNKTKSVSFTLVEQVGTLQINSAPEGATIYLNSTMYGLTNTTLNNLDTGTYNVTVERSGYTSTPEFRIVNLSAGETETVGFTLIVDKYSCGSGISADPYQISTRADVINLSTDSGNWDKYFILTNDISLSDGSPTETIGNNSVKFSGSFDGQGYTISNFTMNKAGSNYVGLFGYINDAVVRDLRVEAGSDDVRGGSFVGVLVGSIGCDVSLINCSVSGNVIGSNNVGGLAGYTDSGDFINCSANGNVKGGGYVGGLIGRPGDGDFVNCYATGDVTSTGSYAGGLVGWIYRGTFTNCYAIGDVTGTSSSGSKIGGLVGEVGYSGSICNFVNCYASGDVTTPSFSSKIGGLVGHLISGSSVKDCFAAGSVTGGSEYGGLVGKNEGTIENCYRYAENGNSEGVYVSDRFGFMDYDFLTRTTVGNGLNWSVTTIDTAEDSSKIWRVSTYKFQYPVFQWLGSGDLQINSIPDSAAIYMNGVNTGESTNYTFTSEPAGGEYNATVVLAGYYSESEILTPARDETKVAVFNLTRSTGTLQINSMPDGADIYLDGILNASVTNTMLSGLDTGTYNVTIMLYDYETAINDTVTVTDDATTPVFFNLVHQTGGLQINSTPSGAMVYLNGTDTNKLTNVTLVGKPVGTYNVTVELAGYDSASRTVTLSKDETEDVCFIFTPQVGTLRVNSTPANATILLDGEDAGEVTNTTITDVSTGQHTITVEKSGYITPAVRSITVEKDEVTDISFTLAQAAGSISVTSSPDKAWIWLDGGNTTVLTNNILPYIPFGTHDIRLVKPLYYNTTSKNISVQADQTTDVCFTLTPEGSKPVASFTATLVSGDAPLPVIFTDTSNGDPGLWNWSFGDGNFSDIQNPVHTYTREGAYDVRLTVANSYGDATVTIKDCVVVIGTPAVELIAPMGRITANETAIFSVTADNLSNITELSFTITYDPALVTIEDIAPASPVQGADFDITIDNSQGLVTVELSDDAGITAASATPVAEITFRATDSIAGLRETTQLTITDTHAETSGIECLVIRNDGAIAVEARTKMDGPTGSLPAESSKYLTVSASGLNEVNNVSFIMEFNRTVISVTDVRANGTIPGLSVDSTIINENGWLEVSAEALDTITGIGSIPLIDIRVHSNGLPAEREIRLVNPCWTRDNATYRFDDLKPGIISITPVHASLTDDQPVTVANMTFDDDTQEVSINLAENQNATLMDENSTILVRNSGIDIIIQTDGLQNVSSEWTGECTGAEIRNISGSADLRGDVGRVATGISADISGGLSALMNPDTRLNVTITRGAVNETMGRAFQLGALNQKGAELEEVAYTMEINKSAFGDITVTDAVIVMSAPELYVNAWGGADNFTIMSMAHDGSVTMLETTYTYADEVYTFTALSPDGFSFKSLVSFTPNEEPMAVFSAIPTEGTAPIRVQFFDYSTGHPDTWSWDFGDGNTSVEQNPAHIYTSARAYDVSLTITNVIGEDTVEEAGYIIVNNPMAVDFTASRNSGHVPLTVTFTDKTTGSPSVWLWEFGDGETSAEQNPVHTYKQTGAYTVSLTATNVYGSVTAEKERFITVSYRHDSGDSDKSVPVVTLTPTPVQTTTTPTPEATVTRPAEFTGTVELPVGPDGATQRQVKIRSEDLLGYLTIDAGVMAQDASGILHENISIVAVPVTSIPSPGKIGAIEHPLALYAYNCTPDGVTFNPAISMTFTLSEEDWNLYGKEAEVGWFNGTSREWEAVAGVSDESQRSITIQVSHFSTYALFADDEPEVPLPDPAGMPAGESGISSVWLWGALIVAVIGAGLLLISRRKED